MQVLKHIMIDKETRGNVAGCGIISLGAVVFDPKTCTVSNDTFYMEVNQASNELAYLFDVPSTMEWWRKQSEEARAALLRSEANKATDLVPVLDAFVGWAMQGTTKSKVRLWGNGADFDNAILQAAWQATKTSDFPFPWGSRCYRTMKNLGELFGGQELPKMDRSGTHHNALDDAKSQAVHLCGILSHIRSQW